MRNHNRIGWTCACAGLAWLLFTHAGAGESVFPGAEWEARTPAEVGLDAGKLDGLCAHVGGHGCVVRHGYMFYSWGDPTRRMDVASACKPVYAHFLLTAIQQDKLHGLNDRVRALEPRLDALNPQLQHKDRAITWGQLASQTSCYGVEERPGQAFDYSDYNITLFFDTLMLKVFHTSWEKVDEEVLHPLLTDPLGCQDAPTLLAFGIRDRPGRLGISCRDFARFGLLYLHQGNWRGRQIIDASRVVLATSSPLPLSIPRTSGKPAGMILRQRSAGGGNNQCDHDGGYSFTWWVNGKGRDGRRRWPDAPADTFGAFGHGGKRAMVVLPAWDMIVSWNDSRINSTTGENEALKLLGEAVGDASSAGGSIIVDPTHPQWLMRRGGGPLFMCGPGDPEGFLYRGALNPDGTRRGDQVELIDKLKPTGANSIYMAAVRSHGGDGDATENPFVDHDPAKGINTAVLDQWDRWFLLMDRAGIVIYLVIYDDSTQVWNTGDRVGDAERVFLQSLVRRFMHCRNLIWCIAEEYAEAFTPARVRAIAAVLREADKSRHPIAIHQGTDFTEFADEPNIDQFAIQSNVPTAEELHRSVLQVCARTGGRRNLVLAEAADWGTGSESRRKCWASAMAGAYVMVLGMDIAGTPRQDLVDCGRLVHFFESLPLSDLAPHDDLRLGGTEYVLADLRQYYVAYASRLKGRMGLRGLPPGGYRLRWMDCASGRNAEATAHVVGGDGYFEKPAGIGAEVVVYVRREPEARRQ